jgi:hypothetical protein
VLKVYAHYFLKYSVTIKKLLANSEEQSGLDTNSSVDSETPFEPGHVRVLKSKQGRLYNTIDIRKLDFERFFGSGISPVSSIHAVDYDVLALTKEV